MNRQWMVLAILLAAAGSTITWYKVTQQGYPAWPDESSPVWVVQARAELRPRSGPVQVKLQLPERTPGFEIDREHFVSRGFGLTVVEEGDSRLADWAIRRLPSTRTLYYRALVSPAPQQRGIAVRPVSPAAPQLEEPFQTALLELVEEVRAESADTRTFTLAMLSRLNADSPEENAALFLSLAGSERELAEQAQLLLAGARIPSLLVHGFVLEGDRERLDLRTMLAVHNEREWLLFDPRTGQPGWPPGFLAWWTGPASLVEVQGAHLQDVQVSVRQQHVSSLELAQRKSLEQGFGLGTFSILNLPIQTQSVYEVLLLVPFGILIIVIMRNIIGLNSFGTFAPVLIALAFRETELLRGVLLFTFIVSIGLVFRFYLERLRLLLVPRLGAVVTVVVIIMTLISMISNQLQIDFGLSVSLFPMIIISMVIERMSVVWEERGAATSIKEGIGSMAMAALAYFVMSQPLLGYWVTVFPELTLVVLALIIALGRYTGFRLTELFRFRQLEAGREP
jgi:hypothetical protein